LSQQNPTLRRVGLFSYSIGILLGILLIIARAWPDLESTMYGFLKYGHPKLNSLSCPVLMTKTDRLPVTIRMHNPLNTPLNLYINAQFSSIEIISLEDQVELQPHETKTFSWEVGKENIDLHYFIFAHIFTSAAATLGMRESTCGTIILNLPFKGGPVIFNTSLVLAELAVGFGLWLWPRHCDWSDPAVVSQWGWMRFVALVVAVGVVGSLFSWWFLGILTLILILFAFAVFLIPWKV
jgi:hypothetical protein